MVLVAGVSVTTSTTKKTHKNINMVKMVLNLVYRSSLYTKFIRRRDREVNISHIDLINLIQMRNQNTDKV